jgi:hypothetical protein
MNQVRGIFGFTMDDSIGKIAFPAVQVGHMDEEEIHFGGYSSPVALDQVS